MTRTNAALLAIMTSIGMIYPLPSSAVTAKVVAVGTYPSGAIFVYFDQAIAECSASKRLDVPAADPSVRYVLTIATAAFATSSDVEIRAGSCSGQYPIWSSTGDSYIYLKK